VHHKYHALVCINERSSDDLKGCCKLKDSENIAKKLKEFSIQKGQNFLKVTRTLCLGKCPDGPIVMLYPEGSYHSIKNNEDLDKLINSL
jgi:NADH:ubiquinone oxidoreductase subunit E